jgi:hypothetical protein
LSIKIEGSINEQINKNYDNSHNHETQLFKTKLQNNVKQFLAITPNSQGDLRSSLKTYQKLFFYAREPNILMSSIIPSTFLTITGFYNDQGEQEDSTTSLDLIIGLSSGIFDIKVVY